MLFPHNTRYCFYIPILGVLVYYSLIVAHNLVVDVVVGRAGLLLLKLLRVLLHSSQIKVFVHANHTLEREEYELDLC